VSAVILTGRRAAGYTHTGRRKSNQDAVVVRTFASGAELVAIADGMGGHLAGEVASALALESLVASLEAGASLRDSVVAANARVHAESAAHPDRQGMGTTLVALLRDGDGYHIANVGDSRAYRVEAETILRLTDDHSFVAEALRDGSMSAEEAARSPWRNALTRAIGTDPSVQVDVFGPFEVDAPHAVLLCTDGLYRAVDDDVIREYVLSVGELATVAETLAALAFRRGSDDNISVAVIEFERLERRPPRITLPLPIPVQVEAQVKRRRSGPSAEEASPRPASPSPLHVAKRAAAPQQSRGAEHAPDLERRRRRRRRERRKRALTVFSGLTLFLLILLLIGFLLS